MTTQEKIGIRIAELRKGKGLPQQKFAYEADIERSYFSHIEKGRKNISIETLERIFIALGVSFKDFFSTDLFNGKKRSK